MSRRASQGSIVALLLSAAAVGSDAQMQASAKHDALPLKATRTIEFTTDEGTWISLDVSPDGRTILFDMLGDLYTMPISGGTARPLTRGLALDRTPRYSPDGKTIAFVSDRAGVENVWVMNADGSGARRLSEEGAGVQVGSPMWTPAGEAVLALSAGGNRRRFWLTPLRGGRSTVLDTGDEVKGETSELLDGVFCREGFLHFSELRVSPVEENREEDRRSREYIPRMKAIRPVAFGTDISRITPLAEDVKRGVRPVISPDGQWIAYASMRGRIFSRTTRRATELRIRRHTHVKGEMNSDTGRVLAFPVTTVFGGMFLGGGGYRVSFPGYAFTPDGRSLIVSANGKITRVDIATGAVTDVAFTVNVKAELAPLLDHKVRLDDGPVQIKTFEGANTSSDGQWLAFAAAGKMWVSERGEKPRRLTRLPVDSNVFEYDPVISPDGQWLAYATWSNSQGGRLWKVSLRAGTPTRPNVDSTFAVGALRWTPDGKRLVFFMEERKEYLEGRDTLRTSASAGLAWIPVPNGGNASWFAAPKLVITDSPVFPSVSISADGKRVYYVQYEKAGVALLRSTSFAGRDTSEVVTHARFDAKVVHDYQSAEPSADGKWLLTADARAGVAFLLPFARFDAERGRKDSIPTIPGWRELTSNASKYGALLLDTHRGQPLWSSDGRVLTWSAGGRIRQVDVSGLEASASRSTRTTKEIRPSVAVPRSLPSGALLLQGARIIPVAGAPIEHGDVLIRGRRIVAVGPSGSVERPANVTVVDVSGATIIPALMDMHAHPRPSGFVSPHITHWSASLAFGVTTMRAAGHANSTNPELTDMGALTGPRLVKGASLADDPSETIATVKAEGQIGVFKKRVPVSRADDQAIVIAAHRLGARFTGHWRENAVFDGFSGWEHGTWFLPMYRDWVELVARSGTTYTPTLFIHGSSHLERVLYDSVITQRQQRLLYPKWARARAPSASWITSLQALSEVARDILRAGGNVAVGTDDLVAASGHAVHAEMLMLAAGGMTPAEVLQCATLNGARALGMEADLGSIEVGKIADLVVLNSNPLDDLKNATDIRYVIKDGVVRAGETLDEVWPRKRPFQREPWMK